MAAKKVLVVVTSHDRMDNSDKKTGYWLGEVAHFCEVLREHGFDFDFVSPKGGTPPLDEKSASPRDKSNRAFLEDATLRQKLEHTLRPDQVRAEDYVAIYYAGGHGTMWDFPGNAELARLAAQIYEQGKVVSAVCHGVTGLLDVKLSDGKPLIAGRPVTGFANLEESLIRLTKNVPFLLEDRIKQVGGEYKRGLPFFSHVEVSGRLVTGQNPQSTKALARQVVKLLQERAS